jgi:signal transduction histidine kinase
MPRGTWIPVAIAVAAAVAVAGLGLHAARHDGAALGEAFREAQHTRLRFAALGLEAELSDLWRDLGMAARLVDAAGSPAERDRALRAVLAEEPPCHLAAVLDPAGRPLLTVVDDAAPPPWSSAQFAAPLADAARRAASSRAPTVSPLLAGPGSAWYRVFALPRAPPEDGAVAILVDLAPLFERLRVLGPAPSAAIVAFGPGGTVTPFTPSVFGDPSAASGPRGGAAVLQAALLAGASGSRRLTAGEARPLGLDSEALATFVPVADGDVGSWGVALVQGTGVLSSQERAVTLQLASLAAILALAVVVVAASLVLNARRMGAVQAQLAAAEKEAHHRERAAKVLEHVPEPVIAVDGEGRVSSLNRAARETLRGAAPGLAAADAFPLAPPDALGHLRTALSLALAPGADRCVGTPPLALAGTETSFVLRAVPLEHPLPDARALLVLTDLTEHRALTSQLVRAEKLATVGVLAAGIAHEIGTPLGVVRGRAERIAEKLGADHPQAAGARTIVDEIDRVSRTIRELLDYSRPSAARGVPVALPDVARTVVELLALEAQARLVTVAVDLPAALPPVEADPDQLQQVLVNVVQNGIHACAPGGHVTIRSRAVSAGRLALEVEDDGAGIPDEVRDRVFDPFFTTKKRGEGTGLGLTIAARLVRAHGGEVDLDSAVGRGTRVHIAWPLALRMQEGASHG